MALSFHILALLEHYIRRCHHVPRDGMTQVPVGGASGRELSSYICTHTVGVDSLECKRGDGNGKLLMRTLKALKTRRPPMGHFENNDIRST